MTSFLSVTGALDVHHDTDGEAAGRAGQLSLPFPGNG
jgi:hypothetical protein